MHIEEKELMDGNKSIAIFLGYEYIPNFQPLIEEHFLIEPGKESIQRTRQLIGWVNKSPIHIVKGIETVFPPHVLCRNTKQLPFNESWNWVMQIVEKIEKKHNNICIIPERSYCMLKVYESPSFAFRTMKCEKENKLLSTWSACVEAIKLVDIKK